MNYLGFEILTAYEDGTPMYRWEHFNVNKYSPTIEDVKADIENYIWDEIASEKERREDDYLLTR